MELRPTGTNVVVFYGTRACSIFQNLLDSWPKMLLDPMLWNQFRFVLISDEKVQISAPSGVDERQLNDITWQIAMRQAEQWGPIVETGIKAATGNVHLHLICEPGEELIDHHPLALGIDHFCKVPFLTVSCFFYLLLERCNRKEQRQDLLRLVTGVQTLPESIEQTAALPARDNGKVFLVSEINVDGGTVPQENCIQAVVLAVMLVACGRLNTQAETFSLGYSALNARSDELERLCQHEIASSMHSLLANMAGDSEVRAMLLPQGVPGLTSLRDFLQNEVRSEFQIPELSMQNTWRLIGMNEDLPSHKAVEYVKRFFDMNYVGEAVAEKAQAVAQRQITAIREMLCSRPETSFISLKVLNEIIAAFRNIADEQVDATLRSYSTKPPFLKIRSKMEAYIEACKADVLGVMKRYTLNKNITILAGAYVKEYERLRSWLEPIVQTDDRGQTALEFDLNRMSRQLSNGSGGASVTRLKSKYKRFTATLEEQKLPLPRLMENMPPQRYYRYADGAVEMQSWRELVAYGGRVTRRHMPGFSGSFFDVLHEEFYSEDERRRFFEEYLRSGQRMLHCIRVMSSMEGSHIVADEALASDWLGNDELLTVETDNAENLTLYKFDEVKAASMLAYDEIHFVSEGRNRIQSENPGLVFRPLTESGYQSHEADKPQSYLRREEAPVTLTPGEKGHYMLRWHWHDNDPTALVIATNLDGERIGKAASISVSDFTRQGRQMDFTAAVMGGQRLPMGRLKITIKSGDYAFIDRYEIQGALEHVTWSFMHGKLTVRATGSQLNKLALRSTRANGTYVYYPIYMTETDDLQINEAKVVTAPGVDAQAMFIEKSE